MSRKLFWGRYFKHYKDGNTLSVIVGKAVDKAFIQVVTNERTIQLDYPLEAISIANEVWVGENRFSEKGMRLAIDTPGFSLHGELGYSRLTKLRGDIMGPFRLLPMECRHEVVSMRHALSGELELCGAALCFDGGIGYIEGDSGRSFPTRYTWVQCNGFLDDFAIMASAARVPFCGLEFDGCICAILNEGVERRIATYLGAQVARAEPGALELKQRGVELLVEYELTDGHELSAPHLGEMTRVITECAAGRARFRLVDHGALVFDMESCAASFEYV